MKLEAAFGSGCIGKDPSIIRVVECDTPEAVTWTTTVKPLGGEITATYIEDGYWEISANVAGAYVLVASCED